MKDLGAAARWGILGGFAIWAFIALGTAIMWATHEAEGAGMWFAMYGLVPVLFGYGLIVVGVVIGMRALLLARGAQVLDRVLWVSGAGSALLLAVLIADAESQRRSSRHSLTTEEQLAALEVSLKALAVGRLDTHQVAEDPIFPTPPVILRTGPEWKTPQPTGRWLEEMIAEGILADTCDAQNLAGCQTAAGATFVSPHIPADLTDYVSVQMDVARAEGGCRIADSVATSTFRIRVIRSEFGWEVARVVTVGGGRRPCAGL